MRMLPRGQAKDAINRELPITDFLTKARNGGYVCPYCGSGTGPKGTGAVKVYKETNTAACHACPDPGQKARKFDVMDAIQKAENCDYSTALQIGADRLGITIIKSDNDRIESGWKSHKANRSSAREDFKEDPGKDAETGQKGASFSTGKERPNAAGTAPAEAKTGPVMVQTPDYTEYYKYCSGMLDRPEATAYITWRGISIETARRYGLGFDPQADPANAPGAIGDVYRMHPTPRIIIPVTPGHYIGRRIDAGGDFKKLNNAGCGNNIGIFNARALQPVEGMARPVFVFEGVFNALSVLEHQYAAVAINSASNTDLFFKTIDGYQTQGPFILCMDNDERGRKAQNDLITGLTARGLPFIEGDINGGCNDANDALKANRRQFLKDVGAAVLKAEQTARRDYLDEFYDLIQTEAYRPYVTGLSFFDNLLDGGVLMQTVTLIMAAPGAGKTTLCQQIAEEMAIRKKPVVFLNLEMSKEQMIAKAISSRAALEHNSAMTATDILQGYRWLPEAREIVTKTIGEYREKIFPYMKYNPADLDSDLDHILSYLDAIGQRARDKGEDGPAVVLDYLHLITTENEKLDDKGLIKKTMKGIKDYCIKYNSFAFIISATNRVANKSGQIGQSDGRDSSNIEYGCDAQISLNFWEVDQGEVSPNKADEMGDLLTRPNRRMILRVLKSRFSRPGRYARVWFNSATSRFYGEYDFIPASISGDLIPFDEISSKDTEATGKDKAKKRL